MPKNNKTEVKPAIADPGLKKEIESVRVSKWSYQTGTHTSSGYNMFDSPQKEVDPINRPLMEAASSYAAKGEEFHWMADAAYHQSK